MNSASSIHILSKSELKKLADVIGEVEEKTSGDIRLMIVKRSSVTGHVHLLLWSLLLSLTFLYLWFFRHSVILWERWWLWPSIILGQYILAAILSRSEFLQRVFTSHHDLSHQVWARAEVEFHRQGLSNTHSHTGVLLFVSLMERQALVLADKAIADKLPPNAWDKVAGIISDGARSGRWAEKLEEALRDCGTYLALHFPGQAGNTHQLPNIVILKE
jgi:putative membrane protein